MFVNVKFVNTSKNKKKMKETFPFTVFCISNLLIRFSFNTSNWILNNINLTLLYTYKLEYLSIPHFVYKYNGYVPEHPTYFLSMTAEKLLTYIGSVFHMSIQETKKRINELLRLVDLSDVKISKKNFKEEQIG